MIDKLIALLNRHVPALLASKGIEKIMPRMGKFINNAAPVYGLDATINFLRDEFSPPSPDQSLRPDEQAANQRVHQANQPLRALGAAAKIGGAAALGGLPGAIGAGAEALHGELLPAEQEQQGIPYHPQKALPGRGQAGYEQQAPIPNGPLQMGHQKRTPATKEQAVKKFNEHKKKKSAMEDIGDLLERHYGSKEMKEEVETDFGDDALMAAINKIMAL